MTASNEASRLASASGSADLQLLKEGKVSLEDYLERRIDRALERVNGLVTAEQKEALRAIARDELLTDPVLRDYLHKATGQLPGPPSTP